jgi:hypothetical protein
MQFVLSIKYSLKCFNFIDSHISLEGYNPGGSILSAGASENGRSSDAILKIAECLQTDFLKWFEQCKLYAACLDFLSTTSCRGGTSKLTK